uniref:Uncharacterized protein n=1 Tax=Vertebrata isogona TaxID=2006944 RepID=A0A1Z1MFN5_9FLOR|nr:hypothetical protein [Vertebrata isogona]ARW64581.1 hypothetical protein [Vertebrata isogona]
MKKEIFLKKLDLLTISLEALILYYTNKNIINEFYKLRNDLRIKKYNEEQNFIFLLEYLNKIKKFIADNYINNIAIKIIENYTHNKQLEIIDQYVLKFHYIYFRNKKYYSNYKSLKSSQTEKIAINENAIVNLYLISKLKNFKGVYILLNYLIND